MGSPTWGADSSSARKWVLEGGGTGHREGLLAPQCCLGHHGQGWCPLEGPCRVRCGPGVPRELPTRLCGASSRCGGQVSLHGCGAIRSLWFLRSRTGGSFQEGAGPSCGSPGHGWCLVAPLNGRRRVCTNVGQVVGQVAADGKGPFMDKIMVRRGHWLLAAVSGPGSALVN